MSTGLHRWMIAALGLLLIGALYACAVGPGYYGDGDLYVGGYYEPYGYDYGDWWGPGYYVGPGRGGARPHGPVGHRPYRSAPASRPMPSIPSRPRGR